MSKYFRATGYCPKEDISFIVDSNGKFTERWQLGAFLVQHNCKVIAIDDYEQIEEINLTKANIDTKHLIIRAVAKGESTKTANKITIGDKAYAV